MSLYNAIFGVNPVASILKEILGLDGPGPKFPDGWSPYDQPYTDEGRKYVADCIAAKCWPTGRFRDIYLEVEEGKDPKIVLFTRNGGGNREEYFWVFDILQKHPNYLCDYDDDFDCTYASIEFSVPSEHRELVDILLSSDKAVPGKPPMERFKEMLDKLQKGDTGDPSVKKAIAVGEEIAEVIKETIDTGKSGTVEI